MPSKVMGFGGRFGWNDAVNHPNMRLLCNRYPILQNGEELPKAYQVIREQAREV